jgi:hypothetical protein
MHHCSLLALQPGLHKCACCMPFYYVFEKFVPKINIKKSKTPITINVTIDFKRFRQTILRISFVENSIDLFLLIDTNVKMIVKIGIQKSNSTFPISPNKIQNPIPA